MHRQSLCCCGAISLRVGESLDDQLPTVKIDGVVIGKLLDLFCWLRAEHSRGQVVHRKNRTIAEHHGPLKRDPWAGAP